MAFWGKSFIFNGTPCDDFDLMIYDIESHTQGAGTFASTVTPVEDKLASRWKPLFYGTKNNNKLEHTMVFGVNQHRIDERKYLDRYEMDAIATWLTGYDKYLWLEVEQEDLSYVRYRCIVTKLDIIEFEMIPWAFQAKIECDSQYAYLYPQTFEYEINGATPIVFYNESSHHGYYMPKLEILQPGEEFSILNRSDNNRLFKFENIPNAVSSICIDNNAGIITNNAGLNLYPNSNLKFFRLVKGDNYLTVTGHGILRIFCEFPINVGV